MIFSEIYSSYFNAVADILSEACQGQLTDNRIRKIVQEKAFGESMLTIPAALSDGRWPLIDANKRTPLQEIPTMPLTLIQKRWLKSLLLDPRIALFNPANDGLEEVTPLFTPQDIVYFDQYIDGDAYLDPVYQEHFHMIRTAIQLNQKVALKMINRKGNEILVICVPRKLEYSLKDDKFRLLCDTKNHQLTVNLARITSCRYAGHYDKSEYIHRERVKEELTLLLTNERNALERCMLHFSDFEKVTEKVDDLHYRCQLRYDHEDETEVLIRVLSFGPKLEVITPDSFREKIKERILKQKSCGR